jgi:hypothetical protein
MTAKAANQTVESKIPINSGHAKLLNLALLSTFNDKKSVPSLKSFQLNSSSLFPLLLSLPLFHSPCLTIFLRRKAPKTDKDNVNSPPRGSTQYLPTEKMLPQTVFFVLPTIQKRPGLQRRLPGLKSLSRKGRTS